jgi:hypothetical protein
VFDLAKKEGKPVMICVNAERVDGGKREPAGKELREHTYLDPQVVAKSRKFVCAMLKPEGASADYAELRKRIGLDGDIVSPQHIFMYSDGTLIRREEYWRHGVGKQAVDALLEMMDSALTAESMHKSTPPPPTAGAPPAGGATPPAPEGGPAPAPTGPVPGSPEAQRAAWITSTLDLVRKGSAEAAKRDEAIRQLVTQDQKGDCIEPLSLLLADLKKDPPSQVAILRGLGKPGRVIAAPAVQTLLNAQDEAVRSNAAVTLEYIGDPRSVDALAKRLPQERDEVVWGNVIRAMGRCGAKQEAVRKSVLHEIAGARNNTFSAAATMAIAYFEGDAEAARELEKLTKKEGDWLKRSVMLWALTEIGDKKSADFVKKEILPSTKDMRAIGYLNGVIGKLEGGGGDDIVNGGMGFILAASKLLLDPARKGRDQSEFKPKGEFEPRRWGGGGGGFGGGGGGGGGGMGG